ncbi:MAG: VRR-NUC domain-containing protein [Pontibacterium sp.]
MGIRENKIERLLDAEFIKRDGITRKWVSPGRDGVPDRICILDGRVWFVEVKTTSGTISVAQYREHCRLLDAGAQVWTVYGEQGVIELMKEVDK